ncbi:hypothetical protein ME792_15910 [Lactobacillus delbrueckii]|nr:hypothetical protein ME792_15910 [Lactobacillus delbrueckii]
MKKSKIILGGLAAMTSTLLAACGASSSKTAANQKLNWIEEAELSTIDVSKIMDDVSFNQVNQVMEGLYTLGNNAKVKNALATSKVTVSKDGKTWTFNIRKNAKWSNSQALTAKDFVYSWKRTVDPKTASEYSYLFSGIKNADATVAGRKKASTLGIKAVGKYKLVVSLEGKIPYFKLLMAFPLFFPQNEQAVKKYGSASKYMVYNGPFVLAEHGSFDGRKVPPAGVQSQGDQRQALRASEIGRFC